MRKIFFVSVLILATLLIFFIYVLPKTEVVEVVNEQIELKKIESEKSEYDPEMPPEVREWLEDGDKATKKETTHKKMDF